ncbi:MAG TPA: hypothetical protein VFM93_12530 [Candidatus Limnocylindria bacterium]|nr:hypothetical protein [Candidatus Limnocylindria bacterium]
MTATSARLRRAETLSAHRQADIVFTFLAGLLMTGVYLDAWAHMRGLPDSFWTPWHGLLYSGLLACALFVAIGRLLERGDVRPALGPGYELSAVGAAVAALGGVGDALWHTVFGVEFDLEAAVSPSHLLIAAGILLLVSGPARSAWAARGRAGGTAAVSVLYSVGIVTIIAAYADPFVDVRGAGAAPAAELAELVRTSALFAFAAHAAITAGAVLIAIRNGRLAPGWLGLIVGGNAAALTLASEGVVGAALPVLLGVSVAAGVLVALAAALLRPDPERPASMYAFAFALSALPYAAYAAAVSIALGTWWSPTFWSGVVMIGGLTGVLVCAVAARDGARAAPA